MTKLINNIPTPIVLIRSNGQWIVRDYYEEFIVYTRGTLQECLVTLSNCTPEQKCIQCKSECIKYRKVQSDQYKIKAVLYNTRYEIRVDSPDPTRKER